VICAYADVMCLSMPSVLSVTMGPRLMLGRRPPSNSATDKILSNLAIVAAFAACGEIEPITTRDFRRTFLAVEVAERWCSTFDGRRDFNVIQKVKRCWFRHAEQHLARAVSFSDDERFSDYVFSSSAEVANAIDREHVAFPKRAIALVEAQGDERLGRPTADKTARPSARSFVRRARRRIVRTSAEASACGQRGHERCLEFEPRGPS
jgi:hypothetical protein